MAEVDNDFVLVDAVEARNGNEQIGLPPRMYHPHPERADALTDDTQKPQIFVGKFKNGWLLRSFRLNQVTSTSTCDLMCQRPVNGLENLKSSLIGRTKGAQLYG